ncbi:rolling circle replication-associated protein [Duganella sp. PWIR1]
MSILNRSLDAESIALSPLCVDTVEHRPDHWTDDKNGWNDAYVARQRVFPDGQCEVSVTKERHFVGPAIKRKPHAKRGESENREANDDDAGRRAKKNVRMCCKQIGADRMVTLTYRENMCDREVALKHWKAFCRRLGRVNKFHYVAVIEEQERGALHFHVAVRGRQHYALLRSIWQSVLGLGASGEQMGQVNVRDPHRFGFGQNGAHKLASYIAKYCSKEMNARALDQKRYFRSKGIVLPEVNTIRLKCTSMLGAVQSAFSIIAPFGYGGMQSWCNNGLGVVWLSTAPRINDQTDCPF